MIFVGQTNIEINISSGANLTNGTVEMCFKKPSGAVVKRAATIVSAINGTVKYTGSSGDNLFDEKGDWHIWLEILYSDLTRTYSNTTRFPVFTPGTM